MVTIEYTGRSGNNLFQYVFARLLAERNELNLGVEWKGSMVDLESEYENRFPDYSDEVTIIDKGGVRLLRRKYLEQDYRKKRVKCFGYFQDPNLYNQDREKIKSWFSPCKKKTPGIVVHLRLTDYYWKYNRSVINPRWYFQCVSLAKKIVGDSQVYIVVEKHPTNVGYMRDMGQLNAKLIQGALKEDFDFIRSFDTIICSNSTFAWWAAFLSNATNIFTFKPWMRGKGIPLAEMAGATIIDGEFIRNRVLEQIDWSDYWK